MGNSYNPQISQNDTYQTKVDVITFTRLIFNTIDDFGDFLCHNLKSNSHRMIKGINPKLIFKAMSQIMTEQTLGNMDLETFLYDYEIASTFFVTYLKRSYMLDLHKYDPTSPDHCQKRDRIFAFLDYCYAFEDSAKEKVERFFHGKRNWITDIYDMKKGEEKVPAHLILLMLLGIIPEYTNKKAGDVDDIFGDMNRLFDFFREYAKQSAAGALFGDTPMLTRFENEVRNARQINWQENGQDAEESSVLNRVRLIYITKDFLNVVHYFSNNSNLTEFNRNIVFYYPDIEGIWVESESKTTNFWRIETISNGFFLYHYRRTMDSERKARLKMTRYEFYLFRDVSGRYMAYVVHPSYMKKLIREGADQVILSKYKNWSYVDFSSAKTRLYSATNDKDVPTIMELKTTNINNWFKLKILYRVEDTEQYEQLLELPIDDEYCEDQYIYMNYLWAITHEFLYLKLDDNDRINLDCNSEDKTPIFMKVPKRINSALSDIRIEDAVGLITFADHSIYFGVASSNLYIDVTTREQRLELGIDLTSNIE